MTQTWLSFTMSWSTPEKLGEFLVILYIYIFILHIHINIETSIIHHIVYDYISINRLYIYIIYIYYHIYHISYIHPKFPRNRDEFSVPASSSETSLAPQRDAPSRSSRTAFPRRRSERFTGGSASSLSRQRFLRVFAGGDVVKNMCPYVSKGNCGIFFTKPCAFFLNEGELGICL